MRKRHTSGMSCTDANFQGKIIFLNWERFEPTNHFISRLSKIVWVNAVMNRTVVDRNWRFHNLSGSHLQKTLKLTTAQVVETSVTVNNSPIQDNVHPDDHAQPTYEYSWSYFLLSRFYRGVVEQRIRKSGKEVVDLGRSYGGTIRFIWEDSFYLLWNVKINSSFVHVTG